MTSNRDDLQDELRKYDRRESDRRYCGIEQWLIKLDKIIYGNGGNTGLKTEMNELRGEVRHMNKAFTEFKKSLEEKAREDRKERLANKRARRSQLITLGGGLLLLFFKEFLINSF